MQLPLTLIEPPKPRLDDGAIGRNQAALAALERFARGQATPGELLYLWGVPGCGKSFWLSAWAQASHDHGTSLLTCSQAGNEQGLLSAGWQRALEALSEPELASPCRIWLIDDVDQASDEQASLIFQLYNASRELGHVMVCAAAVAPLRLSLRDDLRTRLGQGLVFELHELNDDEKRLALRERAHKLGWLMSDELLNYLMTRLPRDLGLLTRVVDSLDRIALSRQRQPSIPLLKELLDSIDATHAL